METAQYIQDGGGASVVDRLADLLKRRGPCTYHTDESSYSSDGSPSPSGGDCGAEARSRFSMSGLPPRSIHTMASSTTSGSGGGGGGCWAGWLSGGFLGAMLNPPSARAVRSDDGARAERDRRKQ